MDNLFMIASRKQFRFKSPQGQLTVEELWDLPLTTTRTNGASLDNIAMGLARELKANGDVKSFVEDTTPEGTDLETKLEIVKAVIGVRKAENKDATDKAASKAQRQTILELIAKKKLGELEGKGVEELEAMVAALA